MFNENFAWNCPICGNLNTYDPIVLKQQSQQSKVNAFGILVRTKVTLRCHHCLYLSEFKLNKYHSKVRGIKDSCLVKTPVTSLASIANVYSKKVQQAMQEKSLAQQTITEKFEKFGTVRNNFYYALNPIEEDKGFILETTNRIDRRDIDKFGCIHARNIFEYYSIIEFITDLCRKVKLAYKDNTFKMILPSNFHEEDYIIRLKLKDDTLIIYSESVSIENTLCTSCIAYKTFIRNLYVFELIFRGQYI